MSNQPFTEEELRAVRRLWRCGFNGKEIARRISRPHGTTCLVIRRLIKLGKLLARSRRRLPPVSSTKGRPPGSENRPFDWTRFREGAREEFERIANGLD